MSDRTNGFTLIETSVVLLIVGLIVAGIYAAREIIDRSQYQRIINDFLQYSTAINSFKDIYGYYPGDYPLATTTFADKDCATANGQGLGYVITGNKIYVFNHLYCAGLLPQYYSAKADPNLTTTLPSSSAVLPTYPETYNMFKAGYNVPKGAINESIYTFGVYADVAALRSVGVSTSRINSSNALVFGIPEWVSYWENYAGVLNALDAREIDLKMDDGLSISGELQALPDLWDVAMREVNFCTTSSNKNNLDTGIYLAGAAYADPLGFGSSGLESTEVKGCILIYGATISRWLYLK